MDNQKSSFTTGAVIVGIIILAIIAVFAFRGNDNDNNLASDNNSNTADEDIIPSTDPTIANSNIPTQFTVTIEDVSTSNTLKTSTGSVPVPFSPPAYAIYSGVNPQFTPGQSASKELELIAEDGFPTMMKALLEKQAM